MDDLDLIVSELFNNKYNIDSTRLKNWDYSSSGLYYVTIVTEDRMNYFGKIVDNAVAFNEIGQIVLKYWNEIPDHFTNVKLDEFIIMPNHIHGIIEIVNDDTKRDSVETQHFASHNTKSSYGHTTNKINVGIKKETQDVASLRNRNKFGPQSKNLGSIIRGFKVSVKKYSTMHNIPFAWQSRFYDHIIRNDEELNNVREYIRNNVLKHKKDI